MLNFIIIEAFISVLPQKNAIFFLNLYSYHILLTLELSGNMFSYLFSTCFVFMKLTAF